MYTTNDMEQETIECEERIPQLEESEGGVMFAGRTGQVDCISLEKMQKRTERVKSANDYRECIPCEKCGGSIEIRGFFKNGQEKRIGWICKVMDSDVDGNHTCNMARLPRRPFRRVVYVMENAPNGFREGMSDRQIHEIRGISDIKEGGTKPSYKVEETIPREGYTGGTGYYRRADGNKEAKWSGQVPKSLAN